MEPKMSRLVILLVVLVTCPALLSAFKIGAFNIKWFTMNKINTPEVMSALKVILPRYDIVLIQEVRGDANAISLNLIKELNSQSNSPLYGAMVSGKLGRSNYKETYIYLYRLHTISIRSAFEFEDGSEELGTDLFEREPYIVIVHSEETRVKDFAIIGIHIKPDSVATELNNLVKVETYTRNKFDIDNVVIAGDLNADCNYLSESQEETSPLYTDSRYTWLINRGADTTVGTNTCAYDRFIISGYRMNRYLVDGTAKAFNFKEIFNLTREQADVISDHYPIEMELS